MSYNKKIFLLLIILGICFSIIGASSYTNKHKIDKPVAHHHNKTSKVIVYRDSPNCKNCDTVFDELQKNKIEYQDIDLSWNAKQHMILKRKAGKTDVSYVFINNKYIGNHEDLLFIIKQEKLNKLLGH